LTFGRRRASQYVNGIVGISKYILQRHLDEGTFLTARQTIIPEPITADLIASQARQTSQARFGYLGILRDDKGLGTLLEAWNIAANSTATLCIAGKGSSEYEAELKAELPNNAKFLGWVDSSTYLANIDFLIVPSVWHEPFGRIVIEAFAKGIPVIGSRIGGIADTIRDGENGFLFTPRSAPELAQCIERCALLDAAAYGRLSSRAHADSQAYEAKRIAREHLSFYESVIADSRQAENRSVKNTVTFDQKALL
jgi:glycosyltransferase involved in cell wall biosynthesis